MQGTHMRWVAEPPNGHKQAVLDVLCHIPACVCAELASCSCCLQGQAKLDMLHKMKEFKRSIHQLHWENKKCEMEVSHHSHNLGHWCDEAGADHLLGGLFGTTER
jgi:hypothetical protein